MIAGRFSPGRRSFGQEQLVVNLGAVGRLGHDDLRDDVRVGRKRLRQDRIDHLLRRRLARHGCGCRRQGKIADRLRTVVVGGERRDVLARRQHDRIVLDRLSLGQLHRLAARDRHAPEMAALDVGGVGAVVEEPAVGGEAGRLDLAVLRRQADRRRRGRRGRDRTEDIGVIVRAGVVQHPAGRGHARPSRSASTPRARAGTRRGRRAR